LHVLYLRSVILTNFEAIFPFLFFLFGSILGSFANVVIVRLPAGESIAFPSSHCRSCQKSIPWYLNIPILAWVFLRGKCFYCKASIPARYIFVEIIMGALFAFAYFRLGLCYTLIEACIFIFGLVTSSFIDLKHMILPDEFTLGGIVVGLIGAAVNPERSLPDALIGVLIGGGFLLAIAYLYYWWRGVEGMGGGDIKLLGWIGAVLGWQSIPIVMMISSVVGLVIGVIYMLVKKPTDGLKTGIPFGPFLSLGALTYLFF
jgi:leader peptidase (prepilin peptidase) / N-methyltransferase